MPKEVLLELIKSKNYFIFLLTIGVFLLNWTVILKLGLVILRCNVDTKRLIFPWALIGATYSLFAKHVILNYLYFLTSILLIYLILIKISKAQADKAFFAALISLLVVVFSFLLIGQPLLLHSKFRPLMFGPTGVIIGSLVEAILPIFFVLMYRNHRHSELNKDKTYFLNVTVNIILLFIVYCLFAIIFYFLANCSDSIRWQILISEFILIGITFFVFIRIRTTFKKEQQRSEENHSNYLLKTILSKQREYRNFFQVIRTMAEGGKTSEIVDYIDDIFVEMSLVETFDEENPIFTSLLVAEQIKAKEKGIIITSTTKTTLSELKEPVKVYDIFKELLQYFVACEEEINTNTHHLNIEVSEDKQHYSFMITRQTEDGEKRSGPWAECTPLDGDQTLQPIKKRIKQLHGQFYYLYKGNDLIGCLFKVGKVKHKQFPFPIGL